ncbi:nitrous oxide reductase family maturation protein NosD [Caldinitratiruptor microaerophilus]|uniref:Carbohydrate-binding/sugar hydrolysis domain-containing protein n=1 Tax=Caldinitratiruptor microaerophilus TaxID=671077 RepID=A0AA35CQP8_9FIRM|nr:nitrous oxide reductase family maturation protein NosD [Caldinitratiruptor microaerophilus]BDG62201.1 hypothetical protein caldi_32910 [Caldinitratiruptor microaerophilus]
MTRSRGLLAACLCLGLAVATPARASEGRTLTVSAAGPYGTLAAALAAARPGDTVEVRGGHHPGPVVVDRSVRLVGVGSPVIDGGREGTVVRITAPGAALVGFVVTGSGDSFDREDAGIAVEAPGVVVEGNTVRDSLFGIYLRRAHGAVVARNRVEGREAVQAGERGDAIRVWSSDRVVLRENRVRHGRDVILWFVRDGVMEGNEVSDSRYGVHLMYTAGVRLEGNYLHHNSVGAYAMYCEDTIIRRNRLEDNRGPSGYGIGLKDADSLTVEENWLARNRVGVYFDNSPRSFTTRNRWHRNALVGNDIALAFLPSVRYNVFRDNSFIDNHEQVAIQGGGHFAGNEWAEGGRGNYWSDYGGYDRDGDGVGDLPYRPQSLFESLMDRRPELRWFLHSPAALAVDMAARALPAVAPRPKLEDTRPLLAPVLPAWYHPGGGGADPRLLTVSALLVLLGVAGLWCGLGVKGGTRLWSRSST